MGNNSINTNEPQQAFAPPVVPPTIVIPAAQAATRTASPVIAPVVTGVGLSGIVSQGVNCELVNPYACHKPDKGMVFTFSGPVLGRSSVFRNEPIPLSDIPELDFSPYIEGYDIDYPDHDAQYGISPIAPEDLETPPKRTIRYAPHQDPATTIGEPPTDPVIIPSQPPEPEDSEVEGILMSADKPADDEVDSIDQSYPDVSDIFDCDTENTPAIKSLVRIAVKEILEKDDGAYARVNDELEYGPIETVTALVEFLKGELPDAVGAAVFKKLGESFAQELRDNPDAFSDNEKRIMLTMLFYGAMGNFYHSALREGQAKTVADVFIALLEAGAYSRPNNLDENASPLMKLTYDMIPENDKEKFAWAVARVLRGWRDNLDAFVELMRVDKKHQLPIAFSIIGPYFYEAAMRGDEAALDVMNALRDLYAALPDKTLGKYRLDNDDDGAMNYIKQSENY